MTELTKTFSKNVPSNIKEEAEKQAYLQNLAGKTFSADVELFDDLKDKPEDRVMAFVEAHGAGVAAAALEASFRIRYQAVMKSAAEAKNGNISKEELTEVCSKHDFSAPVKRSGGAVKAKAITADDYNSWMVAQMAGKTPQEQQQFLQEQAKAIREKLAANK